MKQSALFVYNPNARLLLKTVRSGRF